MGTRDGAAFPARFARPARVGGMKIGHPWIASHLGPLVCHTPYAVQLPGSGLMFGCLLVVGAATRLLLEWQLRQTLVAVLDHAPGGTIVEVQRHRRTAGPSVHVEVGLGARPRQQVPRA